MTITTTRTPFTRCAIGLAALSVLALTGCGTNADPAGFESGTGTVEESAPTPETTAEAGRYPLSEDRTVRIESPGGYNLLTIAGGAAAVTEADCGDHTCVRTGEIRLDGQSIICLPHKVVITVEGGEADGVDLSAH